MDSLLRPAFRSRSNPAAKSRKPLISIIVTHYNYSEFIGDALSSLLAQTHRDWECVVVDDASSPDHVQRLEAVLEAIADERVRLLPLTGNLGQTLAFFAGLEATSGEFVCLLDPDDRYAETFLEEALATHLNGFIDCPLVSTDQYLMNDEGLLSGVYRARLKQPDWERCGKGVLIRRQSAGTYFFPASTLGWLWGASSSIMYRRAPLEYLRPHKTLPFRNHADAYLANGAHMLGGTLFYAKPLVYRLIHGGNDFISNRLFSSLQPVSRGGAVSPNAKPIAREVLLHNKAPIDATEWKLPKRDSPSSFHPVAHEAGTASVHF